MADETTRELLKFLFSHYWDIDELLTKSIETSIDTKESKELCSNWRKVSVIDKAISENRHFSIFSPQFQSLLNEPYKNELINCFRNSSGLTLLHNLIVNNYLVKPQNGEQYLLIVPFLRDFKPEVNTKDCYRDTPLHAAACNNIHVIIEPLIKLGADIDAKNTSGETPLHNATLQNSRDSLKKLIELGADINAVNNPGATCLCHAADSTIKTLFNFFLTAAQIPL